MGKIEKALEKFDERERREIAEILTRLKAGSFENIDVKKLKGSSSIFRVRKGRLRIIYRLENDKIFILAIDRRSEKTYRDF